MYGDEDWEEIDHKENNLTNHYSFPFLISPQIKAMRIMTNSACQHSSIQIQFSEKGDTVSNYRATLGGEDTILLPIPAKWYDQAAIDLWKIDGSCRFTLESNDEINELRHALFSSTIGGFPRVNYGSPVEFASHAMRIVEDVWRGTGYKAYGDEFIANHREFNSLTVPIGTTGEGYMVENLKSLQIESTKFKSIIIAGELKSGTVVFATRKFSGVYPSVEIIASNRYEPFFQVCMNLHGAKKVEVGRISNKYTFSKLDLRINPLLGSEKNCHESSYSSPSKVGFLYTLY
jgi:hypothetical protein